VPGLQLELVSGERVVAVELIGLFGGAGVAVDRDADQIARDRFATAVEQLAAHRCSVGVPVIGQLCIVVFDEQSGSRLVFATGLLSLLIDIDRCVGGMGLMGDAGFGVAGGSGMKCIPPSCC
jgi:hypothetical protein